MDRDRHDRDTCCQTQKGSGSREPLRTGRESGAPRSSAKAALRPVGFVYLGVMVLTWAGNWPLMKLALGQVPPLVFVLFRLIGSLTLIAPALLVAGQPLLPARGERLTLFWVGQLQVAGFLICSIIGLAILPAGRAIVLAYTMPLWAIPIGLFCGRNRSTGPSSSGRRSALPALFSS
jgi:hypothetical protein